MQMAYLQAFSTTCSGTTSQAQAGPKRQPCQLRSLRLRTKCGIPFYVKSIQYVVFVGTNLSCGQDIIVLCLQLVNMIGVMQQASEKELAQNVQVGRYYMFA